MKDTRIVLVSDNHGLIQPLEYIKEKYHDYDHMFHCGDSELPSYMLQGFAGVLGNNDYWASYPNQLFLTVGNHRFLLTHGHRDMVYVDLHHLARFAKEKKCDVVCYGHTHIPHDETIEGVRLLNPGSLAHNRDGSLPSYMLITIHNDQIETKLMRYKEREEWF